MEKVLKRLVAISLSLMLMFTMGINVFAAENVEGTPSDDPAVTLDEGDAVATETEPSDEAVVSEGGSAEEVMVQEDELEVTAKGVGFTAKSGNIAFETIINNQNMFKADTAYLTTENEQEYLVMALSGTGYRELYKGTYEQAVVNGDGANNDTWIHGYENTAGKLEFKIPLNDGESFVPIIAVSNSYYNKYLNGQDDLPRAFYARQITIDRETKTLETDDYKETVGFTVTSNVQDFKVNATASTYVSGGPNNNNYSVEPTLVMEDSTYDKVTFPTVVNGAVSTAEAALADGKFAIAMTNAPNKVAFADKTPIEMTFHVSESAPYTEAGKDVVRNVTIDKAAKTITIDGTALHSKFKYDGTTVQFIKEDGSAFGMWTPQEGSTYTYSDSDGKIHLSIIPKNTTVYGWIHWGRINEELTKDVTLESDGTIVLELGTEYCGWAVPVAPIKKSDETATTKDQYYLAIPPLDLSYATVNAIPAKTYTGKALTPGVTVKLGEKTLVKDTDYTVTYANNTNAGKATVKIQGNGNYGGEVTTSFTINQANNTLAASGKSVKIKKKKVRKKAQKLAAGAVLAISNAKGTVTYKGVGVNKKSKKALKINASNGQVTVKKKTKKGTYKMNVTVTAAGNGNYKAASVTRTITVKVK